MNDPQHKVHAAEATSESTKGLATGLSFAAAETHDARLTGKQGTVTINRGWEWCRQTFRGENRVDARPSVRLFS
ncbi:MAG: hypothetical protein ABGZ35_01315 [Planctomycetaceae bacterium]